MKRIARFFLKIILCLFATFVLFFALMSAIWVGMPSYYAENYQKGLIKQYRALERSDPLQPKIIVIGDSSMAFSVDSALLSEKTGMPCYTLGMQGGMGKEYIFDLVKRFVKEGDIVINPFTGYTPYWYGADLILLSLENEPKLYFEFLCKHPFSALSRLKDRAVTKLINTLRHEPEGEGTDFYKASAFDENGNMVYFRPRGRYETALADSDEQYCYAGMYSDLVFARLDSFSRWCKKHGAAFLLTSGAVYRDKIVNTDEEIEAFDAWFRSETDIPVICEHWSDNFYEKQYMYDTAIHMNSFGMELYTQRLYEDLLPYLEARGD